MTHQNVLNQNATITQCHTSKCSVIFIDNTTTILIMTLLIMTLLKALNMGDITYNDIT